ncbi:MAG: pyridoxal-phosphate dependent enzyme, partial [Myxococcota bacterium]|nr:pyridoxal-phosphate dependent enzyme [Myxococcota bacterium]
MEDGADREAPLDLAAVRAAAERIAGRVLRTPVLRWRRGDLTLLGKAESLQPTGAFKLRGAFSCMTTLAPDVPGVVAHSSGNHAQAVARAARELGLRAVIVMPRDAPAAKLRRTEADGAEVVRVGPDSDERARVAEALARERGLVPVPPFDDPRVAAG